MTPHTRTLTEIVGAGGTDPGLQREVNEDRFHVDEARGLFMVIDGVGGQSAGGKAADIALSMVRERLARETGPVAERVREAIAVANNEIYRLASTRPEWHGMACVLTIAVIKEGTATIGHVGDTRLYKIRHGHLEKITRDHSPVGEREDANELSEFEAMRHPRRNEVYRDVGSEPHSPNDPEFVDIHQIPFDTGDALLLCSDGLTDLVDSTTILRTVDAWQGDPRAVVHALVDAANEAGGKDNVTVVYVEGGHPPAAQPRRFTPVETAPTRQLASAPAPALPPAPSKSRQLALIAGIVVAVLFTALMVYRATFIPLLPDPAADVPAPSPPAQVVREGDSIAAALGRAMPGSEVVVEPGEYRERLTIGNNVRLVSRVPRGATIRLPATASDAQPGAAVTATGSAGGALVGFKIVGDARTPLGVGVLVAGSGLSLVDIEVSGAASAAISFARDSAATIVGADIHDNAGAALAIQSGSSPRIAHSVFSRNGLSPRTTATFSIETGAEASFQNNVFLGVRPDVFAALSDAARRRLQSENWFLPAVSQPARPASSPSRP